MDSCITFSDAGLEDPNLEMKMDFGILIQDGGKDTELLKRIAEMKDFEALIRHPLVMAYIYLQWHIFKNLRIFMVCAMSAVFLGLLIWLGCMMTPDTMDS
ncbi:unnamed protein product, partial [Notodromas monacha]